MMGRTMLAYIPVNLASIVVSFGGLIILTRILGGAEYGRYAIAVITMMGLHMGLFTWLEAAIARFEARAEREDKVNTHLRTVYTYALYVVIPAWLVMMAALYFLPLSGHMKILLAFALSSTCLQLFLNLGMEAHKASHRIARYSAVYSTKVLLSFTLGIVLIMTTPLREAGMFIGILLATALMLIFDLPFMLSKMKGGHVDNHRARAYFAYGMPISISLVLTYALSSADMYLISGMIGDAAAGEYSASYNFANRAQDILFTWISMAVTPIAVTALEKDSLETSRGIMHDYGTALLWIALPAATGIALVAEPVGFIFGESVRSGAVKIMPWIAFAGVMSGMISFYAQRAFMLSGKTQMFVWCMVPPVLVNIGLNFALIPSFGIMGAVYATLIAYALGLVLALMIGRRYYPLPLPIKAFFQICGACLVMGVIVKAIPVPEAVPDFVEILIRAGAGIAIYTGLSFMTNIANSREIILGVVGRFFPSVLEQELDDPALHMGGQS